MHGILSVASGELSTTANTMIDIIGYIAIPLFLAFIAGAWALVKGVLRFTQFMARSEASQRSIADSNVEIRDKLVETRDQLAEFAEKTNERLGEHDQVLAVLQYAVESNHNGNGHIRPAVQKKPAVKRTKRPVGNMDEAENA